MVTGTRHGMTIIQMEAFERIIKSLWHYRVGEFHDGDCVGADTQAHSMVENFNLKRRERDEDHIILIGHPCNLPKYRAHNEYHQTRPIKAPLVRNRDMVFESHAAIATPEGFDEVVRGSGTWYTIRHCAVVDKPLFLVYPDGGVSVKHFD